MESLREKRLSPAGRGLELAQVYRGTVIENNWTFFSNFDKVNMD